MGGTGGPGSDRSAAQTGLQGAGLLAGLGDTEAASATKKALGVADAPQPTSGMLAGTEGAIVAPPGPTSASDTPKDVTPVIPDVAAPGSPGYVAPSTSTVTPPALPAAPTFTLAGTSNLGFPSGVTDDNPFGTTTHVPFGTKEPPAITGAPIAGAPIAGPAADTKVFKGGKQIWPPTDGSTEVKAWLDQHPNYNAEVGADKSKPYQHADMSWWLADEGSDPTLDPKYVPPSYWPYATWGKY